MPGLGVLTHTVTPAGPPAQRPQAEDVGILAAEVYFPSTYVSAAACSLNVQPAEPAAHPLLLNRMLQDQEVAWHQRGRAVKHRMPERRQ